MDIFEYIAVLTSIIIGLGITQLLRGLARLIQNPGHYQTYWVHLLWVAAMFFNMVFWWWWEFRLGSIESWTFLLYSFVVLYAFVFYLACALLSPEDIGDYDGFRGYFYSCRRWLFGLLAFSLFLDMGDSWLKGSEHFASLGTEYVVATLAKLILFITAAIVRNERFHSLFAVVFLAYQVFWAIRMFATVA
jgi:hypothetical protein